MQTEPVASDPQPTEANRRAVFHFMDGTRFTLEWPKQVAESSRELPKALREAMGAEQFAAEVDGKLVVVQMRNVKMLELIPVPGRLPLEWLKGAKEIRE